LRLLFSFVLDAGANIGYSAFRPGAEPARIAAMGVPSRRRIRCTFVAVISSASPHRPKTRELTPEQHSRIRWQIVLLPVYVWLVYGWAKILEQVPNLEPIRD